MMADTYGNPKLKAQGQRRGRMKRQSTGAQTGADKAPARRDTGPVMGTASSGRRNKKPDKIL